MLKHLYSQKGFRIILVSYILVLMIPLILGVGVYSIIAGTVSRQMDELSYNMCNQYRLHIDSAANEAMVFARLISQNQKVKSLINIGDESNITSETRYNLVNTISPINTLGEKYVEKYLIYFRNNRSLLTEGDRISYKKIDNYLMSNFGTDEQWIWENLSSSAVHINNIDGTPVAFAISPVLRSGTYQYGGAVLIQLDIEEILHELKNLYTEESSVFIISGNCCTYSSPRGRGCFDFSGDTYDDKVFSDLLGYKVKTSASDSDYGLTFVTALPVSKYYAPMTRIGLFMCGYFVLCLAFGAIYAVAEAKRRYAVIDRLYKIIPENTTDAAFEAIEASLKKAAEQRRVQISKTYRELNARKEKFLSDIVHFGALSVTADKLGVFEISFPYPMFTVLLVGIENIENIFFGEEKLSEEDAFDNAFTIISSVSTELFSNFAKTYVTYTGDTIVLLLNYDPDLDKIEENATSMCNFIFVNFGLRVYCSRGFNVKNITGLPYSYYTAEALPGSNDMQDMPYYANGASAGVDKESDILYFRMIRLLLSDLFAGNIQNAKKIVEDINTTGLLDTGNVSVLKVRRDGIVNIILLFIETVNFSPGEYYKQRLHTEKDVRTLVSLIITALDQIEEMTGSVLYNDTGGAASRIKDFIEKNYQNPNLDITFISDKLNLTPSYIFRIFKHNFSMTPLDYVNLKRLSAAKELLRNTDLTANDISERVGYGSSRSFSRAMQKYEGMTPGQYRSML